ncbi:MAG: ATP synthase F0 subunit C [Bdellovibrionales bacterium]|nr:ATP synthase F0 subunit C [Bdellovibrionales bacterium]
MRNFVYLAGFCLLALLVGADSALAEGAAAGTSSLSAIGAGLAIGVAALGGTLAQGRAVSAALDSIGRNPSVSGKVFTPMILGLALIESLVILSFVIAFFLSS